jgi:toxin YoeB
MTAARDDPRNGVPERSPRKLITGLRFLVDLQHWITVDHRVALRILRIVLDVARDPFSGIGKPERLKHALAGHWSRRVDDEHRLLYRFDGSNIEFVSARWHYGDAA